MASIPIPYAYQKKVIDDSVAAIVSSGESFVINAAPGSGKSVIFSLTIKELIHRFPKINILIIAHKQDLIKQAENHVLIANKKIPVGVFCASMSRFEQKQITIGSRETLRSRLKDLGRYDVVMIDECHKVDFGPKDKPSSYQKIMASLRASRPAIRLIGYSATPYRQGSGNVYGPGKFFDKEICNISIKWCMDKGYLCNVRSTPTASEANIDTSQIKLVAGDFNKKELGIAAAKTELVRKMIDDWQINTRKANKQCTMFFCSGIKHGEMIAEELSRLGYAVPFVTGETPIKRRDEILKQLSLGLIHGVVNYGLYTEGTDIPRIDCVVIARPAKVLSLYIQMVTRVVRLFEGKTYGLLLDYGGCIQRFGPIDCALPEEPKQKDSRVQPCPNNECEELVSIYANKCKSCGLVIKEVAKTCSNCGTKNFPSAKECKECKYLFFDHSFISDGNIDILSDRKITRPATFLKAYHKTATRRSYVKIIFKDTENGQEYRKNLYHAFQGIAGIIARKELTRLIGKNRCYTCDQVVDAITEANPSIRSVTVNPDFTVHSFELNRGLDND